MRLYPAIDLKEGKCVRLLQGDYNEVTVYGNDPVEMAQKWEGLGGTFLHLVDLDGAKEGRSINDEAIKAIVKNTKMQVEVGGGIRSLKDIEAKLNNGVTRVILGSAAVKNRTLVKEAIEQFGADKIVIGVDAKGGKVAVEGWLEVTELSALDFCLELKAFGVKTIIYTDIAKDGMMQGPNLEETQKLVLGTGLDIVASGGVSSLEDLKLLAKINVEGAIIGKAIYTGAINLKEAVDYFKLKEA